MKKQFWVKLVIILVILCLTSCATVFTDSELNEIVALAILLADQQIASQDYVGAIKTYNRAIEDADDYRLYYNKAYTMSLNNNNYQAAQLCEQASDKFPEKKPDFLKAMAYYLIMCNELDRAVKVYDNLLEIDDDDEIKLDLCDLLILCGETQRAISIAKELWNNKHYDERTAGILYTCDPDSWDVVYHSFL